MKVKLLLISIALSLLSACGSAKTPNFNGVHFKIYDSHSYVDIDNPEAIDYGCINLKKDPDTNLHGEERIDLNGPDAYLTWARTKTTITFDLWSVAHGKTTKTEDIDWFVKGKMATLTLHTEEDRVITVQLIGDDC